jgi:hypothetical protein
MAKRGMMSIYAFDITPSLEGSGNLLQVWHL